MINSRMCSNRERIGTRKKILIEDNEEEQPVDTTIILSEELEIVETIQTAKFESKDGVSGES